MIIIIVMIIIIIIIIIIISFLPFMWKLMTGIIANSVYK